MGSLTHVPLPPRSHRAGQVSAAGFQSRNSAAFWVHIFHSLFLSQEAIVTLHTPYLPSDTSISLTLLVPPTWLAPP